jgi:indolepyruvate decarboxylase
LRLRCTRASWLDCALTPLFITRLQDYNTGGFTARLDEKMMVDIKLNATKVKKARFDDVRSVDMLRALRDVLRRRDGQEAAYWQRRDPRDGQLPAPPADEAHDAPLRTDAILWALQTQLLRPGDLLVLETFTIAFASATMRLPSGVQTFLQALWGSIGFALPAAAGAARAMKDAGSPGRVVLVTGDGSLQMTASVLGNMLRDGLAPIVLVINNDGYRACPLCVDISVCAC